MVRYWRFYRKVCGPLSARVALSVLPLKRELRVAPSVPDVLGPLGASPPDHSAGCTWLVAVTVDFLCVFSRSV